MRAKKRGLGVLVVLTCVCLSTSTNADLYRHWKLDEGSGDTAADSSGNGVDGEIFDAEWLDDDERGTVLEFDGEISWVDAGFLPVMDLENSFSWAFWEKQSDLQASPANEIILGNRWGGDGQTDTSPREFIKFTPNRFEYHMNGGFDNDMPYGADDPEHIFSEDEWQHHVVVKAGELLMYYRNGELFNEHDLIDPQFSEDPLPIAMGGQYGAETWAGLLSDVRLYDHALSVEEIAAVIEGGDVGGLPGDFNNNGMLDAADLDALAVAQQANDVAFDLNGDGATNLDDRTFWVATLKNTWMGDANLDGEFNSSDFVGVFQAGKFETNQPATWAEGDWNGDLVFNSSDFVAAFQDGGFEIGPRMAANAVPEPSSLALIALGLCAIAGRVRRS